MPSPKVAIIIYTVHCHVAKLAESIKQGIAEAGGDATIYQIPETIKTTYPILTPEELVNFDAFLCGVPTSFGNFPAQWKTFWDATAVLWRKRALVGKFAGVFVSTGALGAGQETTVISAIAAFAHHGIVYVPLGYGRTLELLSGVKEVHGGSPWGAGAISGPDDECEVSAIELEIAKQQGIGFWEIVSKHEF